MEKLSESWEFLVKFLTEYDAQKISEVIRGVDWAKALSHPTTWVIGLPPIIYFAWKKQFRVLLLAGSFVVFIYLLQNTLPPPGQSIPLTKLLEFVGGSIFLAALNLYFFIMRD